VENCIKHGLAPKIEGGSITLRSKLLDDKLQIQVQDDGVGMAITGQWMPPERETKHSWGNPASA